jgi:hypothetical protein
MKVAILYICTGKYNQFFSGFYESAQKYFLKDIAEIEYFVFTDNLKLSNEKNVHLFERQCQGFPLDSLFRFDMFVSLSDRLKDFDYCFFFNANMLFVNSVGKEFLPENEGLMAVIHPGFFNKPDARLPYERNSQSTAYIPKEKNKLYKYYMGSLNGGRTDDFLMLAKTCSDNTHNDYDRGIIAQVHDESHLNKYMSTHKCLGLSPAYAYPEGWKLPFTPKIIIRDKVKIDPYFNKGRDFSLKGRIVKGTKILIHMLKWYL